MPRLLSRKNLRYPTVDGQVLSEASKKGVQTWVDNKSVGISTLGAAVGTANTIKFASGVDVSIVAGVASVSVEKADKTVTKFTATADQTTFVASYALGYVDVFLNGVKLAEDQYTASNGTSIVLDEGAAIDDIIEIVAFNFTTETLVATLLLPQGQGFPHPQVFQLSLSVLVLPLRQLVQALLPLPQRQVFQLSLSVLVLPLRQSMQALLLLLQQQVFRHKYLDILVLE